MSEGRSKSSKIRSDFKFVSQVIFVWASPAQKLKEKSSLAFLVSKKVIAFSIAFSSEA